MGEITLDELFDFLKWVVGIGGTVVAVCAGMKKIIAKLLDPIVRQIKSVDMENCKNYLVRFLADVDRGEQIDEIERERFWEQYEHYAKIGGNSYIKSKVEHLQKENKL